MAYGMYIAMKVHWNLLNVITKGAFAATVLNMKPVQLSALMIDDNAAINRSSYLLIAPTGKYLKKR